MKLKLNKNHIKVLSGNSKTLPIMQTPNVAGGKYMQITDEKNTVALTLKTMLVPVLVAATKSDRFQ
ncbi:hypothetical protein PRUB_b0434 [Pseudoalteromonas rubra]|uniref:Uncharacterized protein n=1 Tax=Pseudoalteromonas rubra TaxID=43658 RepID=A0A8T0BZ56_9GAMM|nr:hypothetical protein [Pseudoalteromonas rubra]KAF7781272.1 hypothetical protein PRUB_b0434 [Pseudoalteromonas rubra]